LVINKEFAAKEKLEIVNFCGGAAHFCPAHPCAHNNKLPCKNQRKDVF